MARIDKWLWAARFFKTRSAAIAAVAGGRVHINGERVKASKGIRLGDRVEVRVGQTQWTVVVTGGSDKRGALATTQRRSRGTPDITGAHTAGCAAAAAAPLISTGSVRAVREAAAAGRER